MSEKKGKIYVAGQRGMAGSAIVRHLNTQEYPARRIVTRTHAEPYLTDHAAMRAFFETERPDQVYLAAAKVGAFMPTMPTRPSSSTRTS